MTGRPAAAAAVVQPRHQGTEGATGKAGSGRRRVRDPSPWLVLAAILVAILAVTVTTSGTQLGRDPATGRYGPVAEQIAEGRPSGHPNVTFFPGP